VYNIGSSLTRADKQFQTILTSLQLLSCSGLDQALRGSTDYGLGLLEENLELSQVNSDGSGLAIFQSLPEIL